jgi:hypothetical protein
MRELDVYRKFAQGFTEGAVQLLGISVAALLFVGAVIAGLGDSKSRLMWCGHYEMSALERINPVRLTGHGHCPGFAAKRQLNHLHLAQRIYENDHDQFAVTIEQLTNDLLMVSRPTGVLGLHSDGDAYYAATVMTNWTRGNLLLLDDGRIFFNREERARVSDLCLQDAKSIPR